MSSEWNFAPDVIVKAQEIGIGALVIAHWTEAEVQDQGGTVVGVEIHRYGKVAYTVLLDGGISPTDGFSHDPTGQKPGTISLRSGGEEKNGVGVKPLEWILNENGFWRAELAGFSCEVHDDDDADQKKATAQARFETQILSALTNTDLSLRAENERLRKDLNAMQAELDHVSAAIGSIRWMDPPDGGSVSLGEQVKRMHADVIAAEAKLEEAAKVLEPFAAVAEALPEGQFADSYTPAGKDVLPSMRSFRAARTFLANLKGAE